MDDHLLHVNTPSVQQTRLLSFQSWRFFLHLFCSQPCCQDLLQLGTMRVKMNQSQTEAWPKDVAFYGGLDTKRWLNTSLNLHIWRTGQMFTHCFRACIKCLIWSPVPPRRCPQSPQNTTNKYLEECIEIPKFSRGQRQHVSILTITQYLEFYPLRSRMKLPTSFLSFLFLVTVTTTSPVAASRNPHQTLSLKMDMDGHLTAFHIT